MNKLLYLMLTILLFQGCKDTKKIYFCEGLSPKGEKINCGTVFTTGDLTAVLELEEPFGTDKLQVSITEPKENKNQAQNLTIDVKTDDKKTGIDLSFYNEGLHRITISNRDGKTMAEGEVKIVDTN